VPYVGRQFTARDCRSQAEPESRSGQSRRAHRPGSRSSAAGLVALGISVGWVANRLSVALGHGEPRKRPPATHVIHCVETTYGRWPEATRKGCPNIARTSLLWYTTGQTRSLNDALVATMVHGNARARVAEAVGGAAR
jgi:hypothetical protein